MPGSGFTATRFEEVQLELRGELTAACVEAYRTPGYGAYPYLDAAATLAQNHSASALDVNWTLLTT